MDEIRVASWAELLEVLYADSWQESLRRFRSNFAFRGLEAPAEELLTGLMRLGDDYGELEGHLLRNFRKYAYGDPVPADSVWNWLALAQHYGFRRDCWTGPFRPSWPCTSPPSMWSTSSRTRFSGVWISFRSSASCRAG